MTMAQTHRLTQPGNEDSGRLWLKTVAEIMLLILSVGPGLFFSFNTVQEPWTMFRLARVSLSLADQRIAQFVTAGAGYRTEHLGVDLIQMTLLKAAGWSLEALGLLPIGSLLLALLYYALSRNIARSPWTAAALTLYITWYYPSLYSHFGTQTYAWTNALFLTFLSLFWFWLRHNRPALSILIIAVFAATFLHYHTTPLWIITALTFAVAAMKLKTIFNKSFQAKVSWALPLFCLVFYFSFDTVVYGDGLARVRNEVFGESFIQSFTTKIIAPLLAETSSALHPFEIALINPRIATWSTLLVLLILTLPVGLWGLLKIGQASLTGNPAIFIQTREDIFIGAIILAAAAHTLMYSLYGSISLRVIPLAFPLILPLIGRAFKASRQLEFILTSALAIFAMLGFLSIAPTMLPDITASETGLASKILKADARLLGDPNAYGALLMNMARDDKLIDFVWLDSARYAALAGRQPLSRNEFDYAAIDKSNKPIISSGWVFFEPWSLHLPEIDQNKALDKIYDSDRLTLYQPNGPNGIELPAYHLTPADLDLTERFWLNDAFRLFFTIAVFIFLPGTVVIFILYHTTLLRIDDVSTAIGLGVGLSLALVTFLGYLVNFTGLGLDWLMPLSVIGPWLLFMIYVIGYRPNFSIEPAWGSYGAALIITLALWALLSTGVAYARNQRYAEFTEFFVTQGNVQPEALTLNVINRLNQTGNFSLVFSAAGVDLATIGPQLLPPNSSWLQEWPIPAQLTGETLTITLKKDGISYRELRLSELQPGQAWPPVTTGAE